MVTDFSYLLTTIGNDRGVLTEFYNLFKLQVDEYSSGLKQNFETENYSELARVSHKAKGSVNALGMRTTAESLIKIEEACKSETRNQELKELTGKRIEQVTAEFELALQEFFDIIKD